MSGGVVVVSWTSRTGTMGNPHPPSHGCAVEIRTTWAKERNWFYLTATEFTRALESRKDQDILNQVILDLQAGSTFEESLRSQIGKPCEELYREWLESW